MPARKRIDGILLLALLLLAAGLAEAMEPLAGKNAQALPSPAPMPPTLVGSAPRVGVMTMEPGEEFWERFGHDSLVIVDQASGEAMSYNFGFFDMTEPDFVGNFIRGVMRYYLIALPVDEDLADYQAKGRGVSVQWLDLDDQQARSLAEALAINARPENRRYRYEYFTDNCSTRVRDALNKALDGKLKEQLSGRSQGNTFRSESVRLAWPAKWMAFGFHVGLSGYADRPLSRWDEAFIPMRLRDSLREVKRADGRPLVSSEQVLLPHKLSQPPAEMPSWRVPALFAGLAAAFAAFQLGRRRPRLLAALAMPLWLIGGLAGLLMLYIWMGTAHVAGYGNENILLLSPLSLLLLPGGWQQLRGRKGSSRFQTLLWVVAGSAAIAGFLKFLPFRPQENVEWVLLLLPLHLVLAKVFAPKA
jgi:hypothetical protein